MLSFSALASAHGQPGYSDTPLAPVAMKTAVPRTYFAMTLSGSAWKHPLPRFDVGAVRTFDSQWAKLEANKGQWDFQHLDQDVDQGLEHHADLDLILTSTPTWASARPTEANPFVWQPPGSRAEAKELVDWENYVRTVGTRYKGRVHVYEMWNEPNMQDSYSGDLTQLVRMCKSAYSVLKQIDPSIVVVSPSPAPEGGMLYLRKFIEAGGGPTFDVLGFHFYDNLNAVEIHPEAIVSEAEQLRRMLSSLSMPRKRIWNTESGYFIHTAPNAKEQIRTYPLHAHVLTEQEAVDALARSYALAWAVGIERFYWYAWGDPLFALVDDNGTRSKDVTLAYQSLQRWLLGCTFQTVTHSEAGYWAIAFRTPEGKLQHILWTTDIARESTLPAAWNVTQSEDPTGGDLPVSSNVFQLSRTPKLLR
jgi:hypothetical protein